MTRARGAMGRSGSFGADSGIPPRGYPVDTSAGSADGSAQRESTCKLCGARIRWARVDGRAVALDVELPVYLREHNPDAAPGEGRGVYLLDGDSPSGDRYAWAAHLPVCAGRRAG